MRSVLGAAIACALVVVGPAVGCRRAPAASGPAFERTLVPAGSGWYASTLTYGLCTRVCETRPGAMTASGTAPVPECGRVATAQCFTFHGPSNAGSPVSCWCDRAGCERARASLRKTDYGAPITDVSECTAVP